jgi:hypothetical protein
MNANRAKLEVSLPCAASEKSYLHSIFVDQATTWVLGCFLDGGETPYTNRRKFQYSDSSLEIDMLPNCNCSNWQ